jgi:type IV secretion system protein VirD4
MSDQQIPAHRPYRSLSTSASILVAYLAAAAAVVVGVLHVAAVAVAAVTANPVPGLHQTVLAVRANPANPVAGYTGSVGPGWVVYTLTGLLLVGIVAGGWWVALMIGARTHDRRTGRTTPKDLVSIGAEGAASKARESMATNPAVKDAISADLLVSLGRLRGHPVFGQHEDSYCLIAPARSGKTMFLAVAWVLDAPGPVLATGTKNDYVFLTATQRARVGQVLVLDTGGITGWPDADALRWNPVKGCTDPDEALERGRAWAAGDPGKSGGKNSEWFNARAGEVLAYFLHAAALKGGSMRDVVRWAADFDDDEPITLLRGGGPTPVPGAEDGDAPVKGAARKVLDVDTSGWADLLKARTQSRAGETTDSLRMTLSGLLAPLTSPRVLALLCPPDGEEFDVVDFLSGRNTLYLLSGKGSGNVAPLVTMLTDHVVRAAQKLSQRSPGGRLWPSLRLVLDEAPNVAPLPDLPSLMSDSGGRGITTMVICQSFAQMDDKWGRDGAEAIRANATVQMYLPGIREMDRLKAISEATGRYRAKRVSTSSGGERGSVSTSSEWEHVMTVDAIRRMPVGTALVFYRGLKAAHVTLTPWWERPDKAEIAAGKAAAEQLTGLVMV